MENKHENKFRKQEEEYPNVPEVVLEEKDDKPTGRGIMWIIFVAVVILALIYFFFFMDANPESLRNDQIVPADTI